MISKAGRQHLDPVQLSRPQLDRRVWVWAIVALVAVAACAPRPAPEQPAAAGNEAAAAQTRRLAETYLAAYFQRFPEQLTLNGLPESRHDRLSDNSLAAIEKWHAREDAWLADLGRIDPARLVGRPEWIAYGIMRETIEGSVATRVCRYELWNVNHTGWLPELSRLASAQPVGTPDLRDQALARWRSVPAFIAVEIDNAREGLRRGYSTPEGNVRLVLSQLNALLATPLAESPLYDPARRDTAPAFRAEFARILATQVHSAIQQYRDFLSSDYLPRAREAIGVSANPDGSACYKASIRTTTGLEMSPEEIHKLGLATVAELEAEMREIAKRSFHSGNVPALLERLRTDSAHTFRSREEMLTYSRAALERAKAAMPHWFGRLPQADVVVRPYPAFRERESVGEWNPPAEDGSRPGVYLISTFDPQHKSRADIEPLAFHETIPGHHLQGTIALERGSAIPAIARYFWSPGFGEGWAEYAELLADEMRLYSSDVERLGARADVTLSATLLVVDTGIHAFGWTREQSIDYIRRHTRVPRQRAAVPVDRYPVWPAQGLSYGLGRLEITRLRSQAERTLGTDFDIKVFHDRVLEDGAIPLPLLRSKMERWMAAGR